MTSKPQNERPFQFSLRSLLLFSLAFALLMQYRQPLFELAWQNEGWAAVCVVPLVLSVGFIAGRVLSSLTARGPVSNVAIAVSWFLLVLASTSTCYLLWSRYRWLYWPRLWYKPPQPWPFPDLLLLGYHDWLDARRPPPPGCIKIHGEFYAVLLTLDLLSIGFFGLIGTLLGIVAPGLPRWVTARLTQLKERLYAAWSRSGR